MLLQKLLGNAFQIVYERDGIRSITGLDAVAQA